MSEPNTEALWTCTEKVRARKPLVHNITNYVVMNTSANTLLAAGASPAMVHAEDEVDAFTALVDALVINIGTIDARLATAMRRATARAQALGKPWVLDPVAVGITPFRREQCRQLLQAGPRVVRGNASEILTLQGDGEQRGRGADSTDPVEVAQAAAQALATKHGTTVAVTGEVDVVTDGTRLVRIANGHAMMTTVTGLGCSASALVGAYAAVEEDAVLAATAALAVFAVGGELAAERSAGPGSLQMHLFDALHGLDEATFRARVRVS